MQILWICINNLLLLCVKYLKSCSSALPYVRHCTWGISNKRDPAVNGKVKKRKDCSPAQLHQGTDLPGILRDLLGIGWTHSALGIDCCCCCCCLGIVMAVVAGLGIGRCQGSCLGLPLGCSQTGLLLLLNSLSGKRVPHLDQNLGTGLFLLLQIG